MTTYLYAFSRFSSIMASAVIALTAIVSTSVPSSAQTRLSSSVSGGTYYQVRKKHRRHAVRHNNRVQLGAQRSGVRLSTRSSARSHKSYYHRKHVRSHQRRSTLASRNQRFRQQQTKLRQKQYQPRQYHGDEGSYYGVVVDVRPRPASKCPRNHNCGYRLYEGGFGPRLITPGFTDDSLPPQDGLRGPKVITLD